jgi:cold shock CspA family protein/ribosome-associated translation inhibitor RaiA
MELPLQITFRNMPASPAIEANIRKKAGRLDRFSKHLMACRVIVEAPHRHHHQGKRYHVRIDLTVAGGELAVSREPAMHHEYEDVYVAVRDAFDTTVRRLEDYVRRQRGQTKLHEPLPHGRVVRLMPDEDHGFLETPDGREIFFHRNSVVGNGFGPLALGDQVYFVEEQGEKGPQASTVRPVRKHHPAG